MKKILMILFLMCNKNYTLDEKNIDHLNTQNTFTINNTGMFDFGIQLSYGPLHLDGNITFACDLISIGNEDKKTTIFLPSLPIGSADITLPLKYLMIAEGSNNLYIGTDSSPIPSPDFIIIDNLITNEIIPNTNIDTLTFNKNDNATTLGNENINMIVYADIVNLYNLNDTQINNVNSKSSDIVGTLHFLCSINFNDSISIKTINIGENLNFTNTSNQVTLKTNTIEYATINALNTMTLGNNNLNNNIVFQEALIANSNTITLGSQNNLITKIINVPILNNDNIKNFFYFLNKTDTNITYIGSVASEISEDIDILEVNTIEANFINADNTASTTFETQELSLFGNVNFNTNNINFFNTTFNSNITFNAPSISQELFLYFMGQNNIKINNTIPITINKSYFNTVYFYSSNNILTDQRSSSDFNVYLCVDPIDGKVYKYALEKENKKKKDIYYKKLIHQLQYIKNELLNLETEEAKIKIIISNIKSKNMKTKEHITVLKKILNNSNDNKC